MPKSASPTADLAPPIRKTLISIEDVRKGRNRAQQPSTKKLRSLASGPSPFQLANFNDPIAMRIDWTPAQPDGASFQTHKLVKVNSNRVKFRTTMTAKVFARVALLLGIVVTTSALFNMPSGEASVMDRFLAPLVGVVFVFCGIHLWRSSVAPIVFDKRKGLFWKGRKPSNNVSHKNAALCFVEVALGNIHALQVISECIEHTSRDDDTGEETKNSYYSFELNLVLANGKRINVVDNPNLTQIREDAEILSTFLGKPVWDAA